MPKFTNKILPILAVTSTLTLVGCGGGGISSTDSATNSNATGAGAVSGEVRKGRFVDSAVSGLWYETESQSGFTDANGFFNFLAGESVSFYLGETLLGTVEAKDLVTPLDMLSDEDHPDKLQNILRILQTLDADADSSNGIEITQAADAYLSQFELPLNNPSVLFQASSIVSELVTAFTNGSGLIDAVESFSHFRETLLSERRDTQGEVILDLLNTNWSAEITSTACDEDDVATLNYNFNVVGPTTIGHHRLAQDEDGSCAPAGYGILFNTYETDELFACANECTTDDLNRVIVDADDLGDVVTTITHEDGSSTITINVSYFDGEETQTSTTVLTKKS